MERNADAIARITRMEAHYDALLRGERIASALPALRAYLDSGLWLRDYELDEQGLLPPALKRGVLSQDGLYDLLARYSGAAEDV